LPGLLCKCQSYVLLQRYEESQKAREDMMHIDTGLGSEVNKREVKFDNLYDIMFNGSGQPKSEQSFTKKVVISGDRLDFLDH
jgi:hypothetical protein